MNAFYSLVKDLFFVLGVTKVLHENALLIRTYTLQNHAQSLFDFLSEMAREGHVQSYSAMRENLVERHVQTISYDLYDQEAGWDFDLKKCLAELSKLARTSRNRRRA